MSLARRSLNLQGGRSSVSGITATVFGATGFLGRYVVNRLGKTGTRVVVPFRGDEKDVRHLKVMGDLGVVNFVETSIRSLEQIEAAVADADVVINLLGKHYETLRWRFADVHTSFPAVLGFSSQHEAAQIREVTSTESCMSVDKASKAFSTAARQLVS